MFPVATVADVLVIGGGGTAGAGMSGGGGAGAVIFYPGYTFPAGVYPVTVSDQTVHNTAVSNMGVTGGTSSIGSIFAATGGTGGGYWGVSNTAVLSGSGSGAPTAMKTACSATLLGLAIGTTNVITGISNQGTSQYLFENAGGTWTCADNGVYSQAASGGGGGAGAAGGNGVSSPFAPGVGGAGIASATIAGTTYTFATVFGSAYTSVADNSGGAYYVAGGGAGGGWGSTSSGTLVETSGGVGGGGKGLAKGNVAFTQAEQDSQNGKPNTCSGGGGDGGGDERSWRGGVHL
jgi:hypothetical protein